MQLELIEQKPDENIYAAYGDVGLVGQIKLGTVDKGEPFVVRRSDIEKEFQGQRYGRAMYLGAAALAYDAGYQLTSDIMVSRDAARLWTRLQGRGLARVSEPFQWKARQEYSYKGRARFVPFDQLEPLLPQKVEHPVDDNIWQNA